MATLDKFTCIFKGKCYDSGSWVCETKVCMKCDKGKWATPFQFDDK